MQQQQQQPGMPAPFSPAGGTAAAPAAPSPISSRPPEELGAGGFDHEGLSSAAGDEGERGGSAGNRWPRQETLALLKIRSEMDAAFREAALKGPLWDEVSRRLAAMGYKRSAKKCREKFENVDKYYKRTKDGRAGRGDGKAYRFFSELEALHGGAASAHPPPPASSLPLTPMAVAPPATPTASMGALGVARVPAEPPPPPPPVATVPQSTAPGGNRTPAAAGTDAACMVMEGDVSFSSGSDGEDSEETGDGGKRKRRDGDGGGGGSKVMRFFEGLMRQVMERQEEMQQRFIEALERREQDRMIREEAWRRQEVARLAREQDALAQERAMAASRDAAVVSFIQRITGQTIPMPPVAAPTPPAMFRALAPPPLQPTPVASAAPAPPPPSQHHQAAPPSVHVHLPPKQHAMPTTPQPQQQQPQPLPATLQSKEIVARAPADSYDTVGTGGGGAPSPSRWPKAEVHALIQLRTELEARYQDSGPKGPLWEDISAGMRRLGYSRSAKRCKEKWENINKYFKKVKESNKKRPEDSKTCPYYHQLDALYRSKALASSAAAPPPQAVTVLAAVPLSQTAPHAGQGGNNDCSNGNGNGHAGRGCSDNGGGSGGMQTQGSNGGVAAKFSVEGAGGNGMATNKQDGIIMKEAATAAAVEQRPQPVSMNDSYANDDRTDDMDSDSMDDDDEDDDDEEGDDVAGSKMQYEIQFQRQQQQQQSQSSVVRPNAGGGAGSGPGPAATTSGSFLAMVHH